MKIELIETFQKRLSEMERRVEMLDRIPVGLAILDRKGTVILSNSFFWKIAGKPQEDFTENIKIAEVPVFSSQEIFGNIENLLDKGIEFDVETSQMINAAGNRLFLHCQGTLDPESANDELRYTLICADITDRRQLEQQVQLAQRLEAIGKLAGGIAHDFNNILTVIEGAASVMLSNMQQRDLNYDSAQQIVKSAERAEALTRQLLAFSRRQMLQPKILDANDLILKFIKKINTLIGPNIDLLLNLKKEEGNVKADPSQMEEVLVNLIINARDAMPEGGRLIIETKNVVLDDAYVKRRSLVKPGTYVMISISDSGIGMDENIQSRIFEPFFTTKAKGKGTGMGLATVYGIIKQSGGYIWVYSEKGMGSTFKIYLPIVDQVISEDRVMPGTDQKLRGSETILVVDDESEVRSLVSEMLRFYGYKVMEAHNASAALLILEKYDEPVHLLLTDIVMPEVNGFQLVEKVKPVYPDLKIVFMSGFTDTVTADHADLDKDKNFLQKPFGANALVEKVRDVLDHK